jgi:ubiquinone/menaquinone biosynthesis methyltransferase
MRSVHRSRAFLVRRLFSTNSTDETTHFGFQTVRAGDKARMVGDVFSGVASRYDLMNDLMSGGVHRVWKDCFVGSIRPSASLACLDVAGGTGDIAFRMLDYGARNVTVSDINPDMLGVGQQRAVQRGHSSDVVRFVQADAESLPFDDASFDVYTIAFGIRNCTHVDRVLREAHRVLKRGGRFACLEFSRVTVPGLAQLYDAYSFNVIPTLGQLVASDRKSYQYLVESIRQFPDQETFANMIRDAGFSAVRYENLTFGVAAIHMGTKLA